VQAGKSFLGAVGGAVLWTGQARTNHRIGLKACGLKRRNGLIQFLFATGLGGVLDPLSS
jgi:hypothetical protein